MVKWTPKDLVTIYSRSNQKQEWLADALVTDDKVLSVYLFLKNTVLFLLRGGGKSANIISLEYTLSAIALYPSHMTKLILSTPPIPYPLQWKVCIHVCKRNP